MTITSEIASSPDTEIPLGYPIPPDSGHAISVSLPKWSDNLARERGDKEVIDKMLTGYPRIFIHHSVTELASILEQYYALNGEKCFPFPSQRIAKLFQKFMEVNLIITRLLVRSIKLEKKRKNCHSEANNTFKQNFGVLTTDDSTITFHIVFFPPSDFSVARLFWQHTGMGISSRAAEHILSILFTNPSRVSKALPPSSSTFKLLKGIPRRNSVIKFDSTSSKLVEDNLALAECPGVDERVFTVERGVKKFPLADASVAKLALRCHIVAALNRNYSHVEFSKGDEKQNVSSFRMPPVTVSENDVFIFPSGMTAIWTAHDIALATRQPAKSVCFGFPYTDTLKILQKWGPGCHFFGSGLDYEIDKLEAFLEQESAQDTNSPPILALFTEFPSNPLLRSANLPRLRALADKYDFLIVIDETVGTFVNVDVLPYADIVVTSLSKFISGAADVLGGSLIFNPHRRHYGVLKSHLEHTFEDNYFHEDAICMEYNSRDFQTRVKVMDRNAEAICDFLYANSLGAGAALDSAVIKEVFYPKFVTTENYEICRKRPRSSTSDGNGYGGLFSLTFTSIEASSAFFDALDVCKGPSLGTNFTLSCPFTILAYYAELEWAEEYGVELGLVRVSVGMEDKGDLMKKFQVALSMAREAEGRRKLGHP